MRGRWDAFVHKLMLHFMPYLLSVMDIGLSYECTAVKWIWMLIWAVMCGKWLPALIRCTMNIKTSIYSIFSILVVLGTFICNWRSHEPVAWWEKAQCCNLKVAGLRHVTIEKSLWNVVCIVGFRMEKSILYQ